MLQQAKGVDINRADEFSRRLLDALYEMGLMPLGLTERPASYDKYPKELLAYLQSRPGDDRSRVEMAFQEWQAWVLRKPKYAGTKSDAYPTVMGLGQWMRENADLFNKATLRHLRKSFYGRTYAYLYPRLDQIMNFRDYCQEEKIGLEEVPRREVPEPIDKGEATQRKTWLQAVGDEVFIRAHFYKGTERSRQAIIQHLSEGHIERLQEEAITFLLNNPHYFDKVFRKDN